MPERLVCGSTAATGLADAIEVVQPRHVTPAYGLASPLP